MAKPGTDKAKTDIDDARVAPLQWTALAGLLIAALLPASAGAELFPYWDLDPTRAWVPPTGLGPTAMLGLVGLSLLSAGLAMVAESRRGGAVSIGQVLLATIGSLGVVAHMLFDGTLHVGAVDGLEHAVKAAPWLTLVWGAVGMSHLCRDRRVRTVALAVLAGFAVPLLCKGVLQVFVDHPETVAQFERTKQAVLDANGWRSDSPAALAYERRLMQAEASGWFGLSNVYASFMGAIGAGLLAACAAAVLAERRLTKTTAVAFGVAVCALGGLVLSKSKGGIGAMGLSLAVCAGFAVVRRLMNRDKSEIAAARSSRLGTFAGPAAILIVLAAIGVRGLIGTDLGEKSLLFRAFYAVGSLRIWGDYPFFGVGPDGFQDAYAAAKIPIATETVQSPHSVVFDWTATLGIFGLAWVVWLVWRSTRLFDGLGDSNDTDGGLIPVSRDMVRSAVLVVAAVGLASAFIERELATPAYAAARVLGLAGWIVAAVGLLYCQRAWNTARLGANGAGLQGKGASSGIAATLVNPAARLVIRHSQGTRWFLAASGTALVAHAQIEVTPVWINAAPLFGVWFGLATVGRSPLKETDTAPEPGGSRPAVRARLALVAKPLLPIGLAVWIAASVWVPIWRWESWLKSAALIVRSGADLRMMLDEAEATQDRARLERVAAEVSAMSGRGVPARAEVLGPIVESVQLGLLEAALEPLEQATMVRPGHVPSRQEYGRALLGLGASHPDEELALGWVIFAADEANSLPSYRPRSTSARDWMGVAIERGYEIWSMRRGEQMTDSNPISLRHALVAWYPLAEMTPHAVRPAVRLMDLHARLGETDEAKNLAAEALRRDGLTGLDPIAGLTDAERARAEALLAE